MQAKRGTHCFLHCLKVLPQQRRGLQLGFGSGLGQKRGYLGVGLLFRLRARFRMKA